MLRSVRIPVVTRESRETRWTALTLSMTAGPRDQSVRNSDQERFNSVRLGFLFPHSRLFRLDLNGLAKSRQFDLVWHTFFLELSLDRSWPHGRPEINTPVAPFVRFGDAIIPVTAGACVSVARVFSSHGERRPINRVSNRVS